MTGCADLDTAASYVLGALPEDELDAFAVHLDTCDACRREVAELTLAANALPLSAPPAVPPPALKDRIMAVVSSEAQLLAAAGPEADRPAPATPRRLRRLAIGGLSLRPLAGALAAGLLIAVGVAGGLVATRGDGSRTVPAEVRLGSAPNASATLVTRDGKAQLRVNNMPPAPRGSVYQVWLKRRGHSPTPSTALFSVDRTGHADVSVPESTKGTEELLVTSEPDGGSQAPTSAPVIVASNS